MNIQKILRFNGTMTIKSDLHIGAGSDGDKIGGSDNPIIKKFNGEAFIPGSSLKGAMRCIEEKKAKYRTDDIDPRTRKPLDTGIPCRCGKLNCVSCTMFGAHMNTAPECGEPRLIIRDLNINEEYKNNLINCGYNIADTVTCRVSTMIDRRTGTASTGTLRNMEVVSVGTKFDVELLLKVTNKDNENSLVNNLKMLIKQVEAIGIGSKVTSGCGEIQFDIDFDNPEVIKM